MRGREQSCNADSHAHMRRRLGLEKRGRRFSGIGASDVAARVAE
jgi:hypothetical protein